MSQELQGLYARREGYIAQGKAAALAGKLSDAAKYKELAETAQKAIGMMDEFNSMGGQGSTGRPELPGTAGDALTHTGGGVSSSQKSIYAMRFANPGDAVMQILDEVNGKDHLAKFHRQGVAFKTFLRQGDQELSKEDRKLLREIVLTPHWVAKAIQMGMDDVGALKATMVESVGTLGGYVVPVDFQARVIERLQGMTVMRGRAQVDTTSRDKVEIPVATGGDDQYTSAVRVSWVGEKPTSTEGETNLTFGAESIPIHTMMAKTWLSRDLIEDAAFDIESYLTRKFAEASAIDEDNRFFTAVGAGTPQGILPGGQNTLGLTEKNSGAASGLTIDGLIALYYGIASQYRKNAVWIGERATYEAIMKLKTPANDYFWRPFQVVGGEQGQAPVLMGAPALEQEVMPSIAAGSLPLIFGDLAGYQIFDRIGMTVERYLDGSTADKNTIMFLMRRRLGGQVTEPWRLAVQRIAL